ncbi:MAG TPA: cupin domain-containing protein, partial [Ktedonobacterales bacterium]|nr:cupin domain-containing protein [Ktedonobacterales bacterium]
GPPYRCMLGSVMGRLAASGKVGIHVTNVFIILEGRPLFTVGDETLEGQAGQIVIIPPETPHKFANVGEGRLRQVDIHASNRFITDWLE